MNWQSPFSAFSPGLAAAAAAHRVTSTSRGGSLSSSTESSPEQQPGAGAGAGFVSLGSPSSGDEVPMSRTHQYKKITKPLLERKRRARINKCLDELKDIMTVALQAEGENVSKLEKADILELTVRHLHKLTQGRRLFGRSPLEDIQKFQAGYSSAAQEAATFLLSVPEVDVRVSQRLVSHLSSTASAALAANIPPLSLSLPQLQHQQRLASCQAPGQSPQPQAKAPHSPAPAPAVSTPSPPVRVKTERPSHSPPHPAPGPAPAPISFTLSIRRQTPEPLTERSQNEKALPIKPAAIRLNPSRSSSDSSEGVWRPYSQQ